MPTKKINLDPVQFVNDEDILLTAPEQEVLARLFIGYRQLVIKGEIGGGFGGGRVLLVRPVQENGAELPAIIKLGQAAIIQQEWGAFARHVHRKVPKVAHIEGEPVFTADSGWGGIRYPLAGDGRFPIESLGMFCHHATVEDLSYVLEYQLFPSIDALWQDAQPAYEFPLGRSLDPVLPVNLVVAFGTADASVGDGRLPGQTYTIGETITLVDFLVTEVDSVAGELTLDLPAGKDGVPGGQRIRVTAVPDTNSYEAGQLLPGAITGVVQATRGTFFETQLSQIFSPALAADAETVTLPGIGTLPNPLRQLPDIMKQREDVRMGVVHGDLNLENVLIEYDHKSRNIHLIDFANARRDWVLHDLLRLETNIWLHLVPGEMVRHGRDLSHLPPLVASLQSALAPAGQVNVTPGLEKPFHALLAIRRRAQHLLMTPHAWGPYWQGLCAYLVGALKFHNLDRLPTAPLPKQVAFVAAASLLAPQPEQPGVKTPEPISSLSGTTDSATNLLHQLRIRLTTLDEFKTQEDLQNVFDLAEALHPFRDRLPDARNARSRANKTVAYLQSRFNTERESALVLFLRVLADEYEGVEQTEINEFADQLEQLLRYQ